MVSTRIVLLTGTLIAGAVSMACSAESPLAPGVASSPDGAATRPAEATPKSGGVRTFSSHRGPELANVSNQGGAGVYAMNGASLVRQPNGLQVKISVPTPQPDTYNYPAGKEAGHPEVFTMWVFIFNNPELCSDPCNADDLGVDTPARGGVYNGGGHVAAGAHVTIAGRIGVGQPPFNHAALESPATAEVHYALAPHGALDPSTLPGEFRSPTGPMAFWWIARFK